MVSRTELTPVGFLWRSAAIFPDKTAVVHGERRLTYRDIEKRVNRFADALVKAGLRRHDRVAMLCPNTPAMLEAHYAVPAAGGVLVTINTRLNAREIEYILHHSDARFLFVDQEFYPLISGTNTNGITVTNIDDTGLVGDPYEEFIAQGDDHFPAYLPDDEEEPIAINYTSGTTGLPKGVVFTHRGAYLNTLGEVIETGMNANSVYLWTLPMFHCNGWCFTWAVTAVGGTHVCLRKLDPALIWDILEKESVTHFNGAPTVQTMLLSHPKAHVLDNQVTVTIAGAPPSPTLLERIKVLNFRPVHVYGLTETYGPITICEWHREWDRLPPDEQARRRARQGQAYLTADLVRVADDQMNDIPRDGVTTGEVIMRGNNVMKEYFKDTEATEQAFRGGWFHSGDIAVWHTDGYIELRDRLKDIIISGGENISTIEIEQVIVQHPAVLECAVIAVPDEKWGERPKAFITLKKDSYASQEEILDFCRQHMAHFKCPAAIEFGELPKTSTGKVQKYLLREKEWISYQKRIH
jgi:fatty-acyl-CoA synthase